MGLSDPEVHIGQVDVIPHAPEGGKVRRFCPNPSTAVGRLRP